MAGYPTNLDTLTQSQGSKEVTINELFDSVSIATVFARRGSACVGLTWAYYGGYFLLVTTPTYFPNGTLSLTPSSTNYIQVSTVTGVIGVYGSWQANHIFLYQVSTNATGVTGWSDLRTTGLGKQSLYPSSSPTLAGLTLTGALSGTTGTFSSTLASTGNLTVNTNKLIVDASTGNLTSTGYIVSSNATAGIFTPNGAVTGTASIANWAGTSAFEVDVATANATVKSAGELKLQRSGVTRFLADGTKTVLGSAGNTVECNSSGLVMDGTSATLDSVNTYIVTSGGDQTYTATAGGLFFNATGAITIDSSAGDISLTSQAADLTLGETVSLNVASASYAINAIGAATITTPPTQNITLTSGKDIHFTGAVLFGTYASGAGLVSFDAADSYWYHTDGMYLAGTSGSLKVDYQGDHRVNSSIPVNATNFQVADIQVVGARQTGWTASTGTHNRGAYASYGAGTASGSYTSSELQDVMDELQKLARRVYSLETDLATHGIIGT